MQVFQKTAFCGVRCVWSPSKVCWRICEGGMIWGEKMLRSRERKSDVIVPWTGDEGGDCNERERDSRKVGCGSIF